MDAHNEAWLDAARALAALAADSRLTVLDGTDHQVPLHRPDAVVAAVRELVAATG